MIAFIASTAHNIIYSTKSNKQQQLPPHQKYGRELILEIKLNIKKIQWNVDSEILLIHTGDPTVFTLYI